MTKEQIDAVIALGPLLIAAIGSTVVSCMAVGKFFELQKTKVVEKSVGLTKILEFHALHKKVLDDMDDLRQADKDLAAEGKRLKERDEEHQQRINKLDADYREMVSRFFDFYKGAFNIK